MTLGFIAAFIGIFVGLVAVLALGMWFMSKYGEYVAVIVAFLGALALLGWVAWQIAGALISKG